MNIQSAVKGNQSRCSINSGCMSCRKKKTPKAVSEKVIIVIDKRSKILLPTLSTRSEPATVARRLTEPITIVE